MKRVLVHSSFEVFLRRIQPKVFTDEETSTVEKGAKRYSKVENLIIDVKKNTIIVFLPDRGFDEFETMLSRFPRIPGSAELKEMWEKTATYLPMMRFVLVDKKSREFAVERWCFLGSIDDWEYVDTSNDLAELVKKYCRHLGKDSFYELSSFNTEGTPL